MRNIFWRYLWSVWLLLVVAGVVGWNLSTKTEQQFVYLARDFLQARVHLSVIPGSTIDLIDFEGKLYWHLGPLPGLILVPLVWMVDEVTMGFPQLVVMLFIGIWAYELARVWGNFDKESCVKLATGMLFGSILLPELLTPKSWHFSQVITVLFIGLYIREVLRRKNYWLVGLWLTLAGMTRFNAFVGVVFGLMVIVGDKSSSVLEKGIKSVKMLTVMFVGILLLMGYNFARFGSVWESGYTKINSPYISDELRKTLDKKGMFQLKYMPGNLYDYFFHMPDFVNNENGQWVAPYFMVPDPGGVNVWFTFLWLVYVVKANYKRVEVLSAGVVSGLLLGMLLMFYASGGRQVGPRYFCDLLPYLYLMILSAFKDKKLTTPAQIMMIVSSGITWYLYGVMGGI